MMRIEIRLIATTTSVIITPNPASTQRIGYSPRSTSRWKPATATAIAARPHRNPSWRRSGSRHSRGATAASSAQAKPMLSSAAGACPIQCAAAWPSAPPSQPPATTASPPDSQNAARAASQSSTKRTTTRGAKAGVAVNSGTAVSTKPATAASPKPNISS